MTDLLYTDVEESLRGSVRSTLQRSLDEGLPARLADEPDTDVSALWRTLAEQLGVAGLLVPESLGGVGASAREAAVVLEELGRAVAPTPFLTSAVVATTTLLSAGDETHLPRLASGEVVATLALPWTARRGAWSPVDGVVAPVAGALTADLFLVPVTDDGGETSLRALGRDDVELEPITSLDMTRPLARVTVTGQGSEIATGDAARAAVDAGLAAGAALLASEQLGLAQWSLETTVEYAKTRVQFARPIGSFQAIKHRLADLYLLLVGTQAAARQAAGVLADDPHGPEAQIATATAAAYCSDAAVRATEEALQLHGGIGMTWEAPVHTRLKRAAADRLALGTPDRHRSDLAALVDLPVS
ncbi:MULTISPECIES: acyl-CoA dehydrogenase family protein [Janibacter]|uniref:Acyl-CoA dehydrogenase n=1 Tax=Janibacter hoylei PVAS-1 TaxID=1210046 RepID=K1E4Y5_9MICO|nr:acyl-CoA dehydrogenase family protein [Janibacter hoylei]EKA60447.1 acyl-CoA dehydrogenase domain-containing protein [Janibacter hoylei PVAS-1]MCT1618480.1 acyl-CoA/acyl-ACP dehydrogenase [Janibacter hoylei]MCT2293403.1 acyl-CoA/acyl-ACP dehydrogenase [Janibacter hoylei]MCW4602298.1 acyl-CoA/acyl-ACP dehydrogenase [Janibacter hoylei]RWU82523.1 acyl-CoA dehydrogenase [Janibacter hoylei PVAS-1]